MKLSSQSEPVVYVKKVKVGFLRKPGCIFAASFALVYTDENLFMRVIDVPYDQINVVK